MSEENLPPRKRRGRPRKVPTTVEKKMKIDEENNSGDPDGSVPKEQEPVAEPLESCSICFNQMDGEFISSPKNCRHHFCVECLENWSKNQELQTTCPLCRTEYTIIQVLDRRTEKCIKETAVVKNVPQFVMNVAMRAMNFNGPPGFMPRRFRRSPRMHAAYWPNPSGN